MELLIRHIEMLKVIRENQPVGIIKLSELTEIPRHKIRYSLKLLEKDNVIAPSPEGAVTTELYDEYMWEMSAYLEKLIKSITRVKNSIA
ncbi:MAG: hypothetical protein IJF47_05270 [Candidatus Methanomethylophilaceae archaeon]|nr:hypothetical protein [Candidatus Methanomethylophilaceae archaeon]